MPAFAGRHRLRDLARLLCTATVRSVSALRRVVDLLVTAEIATRQEVVERLADLAEARREAEYWKERTATCEARIADLEEEVAAANLVAMDLRARLVCLHGKLATTAATARYQSFTSALESRAP